MFDKMRPVSSYEIMNNEMMKYFFLLIIYKHI